MLLSSKTLVMLNIMIAESQLLMMAVEPEVIIYKTRKTVFDHISKHREESWKYDACRSVFDELQSRCLEMRSNSLLSVWYIFSMETKAKPWENEGIKS